MSKKPSYTTSVQKIILLSFILAFSCLVFFSFYTYRNLQQGNDLPKETIHRMFNVFFISSVSMGLFLLVFYVIIYNALSKRKKEEQKIIKANLLYAVMSQVNQAIVHDNNSGELLKKLCRIAIEYGKFRMAWIGLVNTENKLVIPIEHAGFEEGYLSAIKISVDETAEGFGPMGNAILQGSHYVCNDIKKDPLMLPWRREALLRGYQSIIVLPIIKSGWPVGAFTLYAPDADFFDQEEIDLLDEVVKDISAALEFFDRDGLRRANEEEILKEKLFSDSIINSLPGVFYLFDGSMRYLKWNIVLEEISGYTHDEISEMSPLDFFGDDQRVAVQHEIEKVFSDGPSKIEADIVTKEGKRIPFYFTGVKVDFKDRSCLLGVGIDISKLKEAEHALKENEDKYRKAQAIGRMGHWEFNIESNRITWSDEVYHIFNMDHKGARIDFETFFNYIHPEDRQIFLRAHENSLSGETKLDIIHRVILKNGTTRHLRELGELVHDDKGRPAAITGTVQDVTETEQKELEIQQMNQQLRALAASLQNIREEERTSISREIHDDLGQQLTAIKIDMFWVNKKIQDNGEVKQKINNIILMLNNSIQSIRKISTQLRPSVLDDLGLVDALQWQIEEFQERYKLPIRFTWPEEALALNPGTSTGLFRIFQETLTNIARHAEATAIKASLYVKDQALILNITDNGNGFEWDKVKTKKTLGLLGMKERTLMMGGHCEISSKPGEGTTVEVSVPLDNQDKQEICAS